MPPNYLIETQSELLGIFNTRDTDGLVKGLDMITQQLKMTGSCKPLLDYARLTNGKLPELFQLWETVQHDMRLASVPYVLECTTEIVKFLNTSDNFVASMFVTIIIQEHLKLIYRALCNNQDLISITTLNLLISITKVNKHSCDLLFKTFDFTLNPLPTFCTRKKAGKDEQSPRSAFVDFMLEILKMGSMETKMAAASLHSLYYAIVAHLNTDQFSRIKLTLDTLKETILDCRMRNLSLTFFSGAILNQLLQLYNHGKSEVVTLVDSFLTQLMTDSMVGPVETISVDLSVPFNPSVKNKQVLEFLQHLKPLESVLHQRLAIKILRVCPDILVPYLRTTSKSFRFGDVQAEEEGSKWVALMGFAIQAAQITLPVYEFKGNGSCNLLVITGIDALSMGRVAWTRALQNVNPLAKVLSLTLLQSLLQRLYHFTIQLENSSTNFYDNRDMLIQDAMKTLPDNQTILNLFKTESKESTMISVMKYYCMLFAPLSDFAFDHSKFLPENLTSIQDNCRKEMIELISVLTNTEFFEESGWFEQAAIEGSIEAMERMLSSTGFIPNYDLWARIINKDKSLAPRISNAIRKLKANPTFDSPNPLDEMFPDACLDVKIECISPHVPDVDMNANIMETDMTPFFNFACDASTNAVLISNELLSLVDKNAVLKHLVYTPITVLHPLPKNLDAVSFHNLLYKEYNPAAWYSIIASILNVEELTDMEVRQLVESNLLAFLVVSLSHPCSEALAKNLLEQFMRCLEWCHVRERNQLSLLLQSVLLMKNATRLQCMFIAHSIPIIIQPSHPLFYPLVEYLLTIPTLPSLPFFDEALMIKYLPSLLKSDDMQRDIIFVLDYIKAGFITTDQQASDTLRKTVVHLKSLLIQRSTKKWKESVEKRVYEILDMLNISQ